MAGDVKDIIVGTAIFVGAAALMTITAPVWVPGFVAAAATMALAAAAAYGIQQAKRGILGDGEDPPAAVAARIAGTKANFKSTQASIPVVYGVSRVGLRVMDMRVINSTDSATPLANPASLFTTADNNDVLVKVGAFALGSNNGTGIQAVDNIRMYDDGVDVITNPVAFSVAPSSTGVAFPYDSKLKYTLEDGDDSQTANSLVKNSLGWGTDMKGAGVAYGAFFMFFDTDVWQGIPTITAEITGNRVYDPRTEAYINFSAVKTAASSDNPALCILDYLTSARYGGGVPYEARDGGGGDDFIHEQSFIDAANYCDALVSIPTAELTEKRFRMSAAINTGQKVGANISRMLDTCRGEIVWQSGTYRLVINQVTTAETFELTEDNIVGEMTWNRHGALVPNSIETTFPDARGGDYNPVSVVWPLTGDMTFLDEDNGVENRREVGLEFVSGYYQALRTIMVRLREARNDVSVALMATKEAYKLQVGEVVKVSHEGPGWDQEEFRVRQVSLTTNGLVALSLQQYNDAAYFLDTLDAQPSLPTTNLPDTSSIAVPTSVAATSDTTTALDTQDGQAVPRIKLAWTPPSDPYLTRFNVRFRDDSVYESAFEAGPDANREDTSIFIWPVSEGTAYTVEIRSVNAVGVMSAWVSVTVTVVTLPSVLLSDVRAFPDVPSAGNVTVQWSRSSSTHEIWAFVKTLVLPVDDDDNPWPGDAIDPTSVLASGTDSIVVAEPAAGSITYLQLEPRSLNGTPGRIVRATVDPASVSVEIETPTWGIVTESEGATDGTFKVKLYDPDAVTDDVFWRKKLGTADWTAYVEEVVDPTNLVEYEQTAAMVERHPSFVEFRGRYTVNGVQHTTVIKSSGLDLGKVPNITVALATDEVGLLSANVQGDVDTASIKILASKTGQPTDGNTRLEASQDGRMFTAANIGTVTLDVGETGYVTAFGYGEASGAGIESTASAKVIHKRPVVVVPTIEDESQSEDGTNGTFTVKALDPQGLATDLYYRTKSGAGAWTAWTLKTATPADATSYTETVTLVEGHQSFVQFQLWYDIGTKSFKVPVTSGGFDLGRIADGSFVPAFDESARTASGSAHGDIDTTGWKIVGQTSGVVSDSTVNSAITISGRTLTPAQVGTLVSSLSSGDTVYFGAKAIGPDGNGPLMNSQLVGGEVAPQLAVTAESESGSTGTFSVTLSDPSAVATSLDYRTKSGAADWSAWAVKDATPNNATEYTQTVALIEGHHSFVAFRMVFSLTGSSQTSHVVSGGFDLGRIAGGSFTPSVDSLALTASASAQGDVDTTSWKIVGQTSGVVAEGTVDAATPIAQRSPTPAQVGTLASSLTVGQTVYFGAKAIGPDGNGPLLLHQMTLSHIPPNLSVSTESEDGTNGTFAVALSDPSGVATALDYRTKSGNAAWSGWVSKDSSPTVGESPYSQTVGLVEGHLSFIAFRLTYVLRGNTQYRHLVSGGFDIGKVANGSFIPVVNTDAGTATASAQGDTDTTGWKIKASTSAVSTADIDAVTGDMTLERSPTVSQVGTLLSGLTTGDTVYFGARAIGDTNGPYLFHEIIVEKATPRIRVETESEDGTDGTFAIRLSDPDGAASKLESRTKLGGGAWSAYGYEDTTLADDDTYTRDVALVEGHLSFVDVRMTYALRGVTQYAHLGSAGFDKGTIPNISVSLTTDETGVLSANVQGDSDTASIRILGSTSGQPSDGDTRAATAKDGRMFATSDIGTLATLDVGDTGYVTAFGYSAASGGGTESTASVKVRHTRPGEFKPEVQVVEVRTDVTSVVTIDVKDTFLRVTDIEYKKRNGADGGGFPGGPVIDASWLTAWTETTGTIGTHVTLQREINVPVADGTEGELQWQVKYTDVNGVVQTFGDTLRVVNLAGTSRSIVVPYSALQQDYPGDYKIQTPSSAYTLNEIRYAPGYAFGSDNGYAPKYATVLLPPGVTVTKMTTIGYRENTGDLLSVNFYSFPFDGSLHTGHGYTTHDTTGWQSTETVLDVDVATDRQYVFYITMRPDFDGGVTNTGIDVRVASMKFDYTRPAYSYSY